jgi:hypothetical protein
MSQASHGDLELGDGARKGAGINRCSAFALTAVTEA